MKKTVLLSRAGSGQLVVSRIVEGTALEDKRVYQEILSKLKGSAVDQGVHHQLMEVR